MVPLSHRRERRVVFVRLRPYVFSAILASLIYYFGFQALTGDRGLLTLSQRNELLAARQAELAKLQAQRRELEVRARLLRDGAVSRDLVEERARYLLGFSDPRDYVIRTKP
jgi:cell division protein FtsB